MKTIKKYIILATTVLLGSATIFAQNGSQHEINSTESIEIVYTDANTAYAVDIHGNYIYKSTDSGLSWVNVIVPENGQIKQIFVKSTKHKSGSKGGFEGESKVNAKDIYMGSTGFMPADDFKAEHSSTTTNISFTLLNPGFVSIKIYDNSGKAIDEITKSSFGKGKHTVKWNRSKFQGSSFYYSLVTSEFAETRKIENSK